MGLANITGLKRVHLVVVAGAVGTVLSDFLYNNFVSWLVFLSVSLPPIGGVIIGDFYLRCKTKYPDPETYQFKKINWAAMIAWAIAISASLISPADGVFSVAPLNAIAVAMFSHVILYRIIYSAE